MEKSVFKKQDRKIEEHKQMETLDIGESGGSQSSDTAANATIYVDPNKREIASKSVDSEFVSIHTSNQENTKSTVDSISSDNVVTEEKRKPLDMTTGFEHDEDESVTYKPVENCQEMYKEVGTPSTVKFSKNGAEEEDTSIGKIYPKKQPKEGSDKMVSPTEDFIPNIGTENRNHHAQKSGKVFVNFQLTLSFDLLAFSGFDFKDSLKENFSAYAGIRRILIQVFALEFGNGLPYAFNNLPEIIRILRDQNERNRAIKDEGFRLATFSLSPPAFDKGDSTLRLAAQGFFCDFDGRVKCAFCGKTNINRIVNERGSHENNCITQSSNLPVGRTIVEDLGASSPEWFVPSVPDLPANNNIEPNIHLSNLPTLRFGYTEQFFREEEEDCFSVARSRGCLARRGRPLLSRNDSDMLQNFPAMHDSQTNQYQEQENWTGNEVASVRSAEQTGYSVARARASLAQRVRPLPSLNDTDMQHNSSTVQCSQSNQDKEQENEARNEVQPVSLAEQIGYSVVREGSSLARRVRPLPTVSDSDMSHYSSNVQGSQTYEDQERENNVGKEAPSVHSAERNGSRHPIFHEIQPKCSVQANKKFDKRDNTKDIGIISTHTTENAHMRSRTECCVCKKRRCNIVFKPCGHLVVCDRCVKNVTVCPRCDKKVDTAIKISNYYA